MNAALRTLFRQLYPRRRPARVLYRGAALWMIAALVHVVPLAADGWRWSGSVSFRKPLTFALSVGLLLATVGWILDRLPERRRLAGALAWTLLVSSTIEVGLIALQAWRGRASHFNVMEGGDAAIFGVMAAMVGVMSVCLLGVLLWSVIERPADPLVRWAAIGGMVLVATGLGIGQWIVGLGVEYVEARGAVPDTVTYGEAGVVKFPHAVAFHGIQLFILTAVALRIGSWAEGSRATLMRLVVLSYAALLVLASLQTVAGLAPLAPSPWSLGQIVALAVLVGSVLFAVRGLVVPGRADRKVPAGLA